MTVSLHVHCWVWGWKNFDYWSTFGEVMGKSRVSCFFDSRGTHMSKGCYELPKPTNVNFWVSSIQIGTAPVVNSIIVNSKDSDSERLAGSDLWWWCCRRSWKRNRRSRRRDLQAPACTVQSPGPTVEPSCQYWPSTPWCLEGWNRSTDRPPSNVHNLHIIQIVQSTSFPAVLWHCWFGGRKGIWPVKLGVGLLMVMMWLELCMSYSSSCHQHLHRP